MYLLTASSQYLTSRWPESVRTQCGRFLRTPVGRGVFIPERQESRSRSGKRVSRACCGLCLVSEWKLFLYGFGGSTQLAFFQNVEIVHVRSVFPLPLFFPSTSATNKKFLKVYTES